MNPFRLHTSKLRTRRPTAGRLWFALVPLIACGCSSARKAEIPEASFRDDRQLARGRVAFMHVCNQCHVLGGPGLGPGLNDKPLPGVAIRTQVRVGAGAMPAFTSADLSDEELNVIVRYLKVLREQESPLASRG